MQYVPSDDLLEPHEVLVFEDGDVLARMLVIECGILATKGTLSTVP